VKNSPSLSLEMEDCDDMNILNNSDNKEKENIDYEESQLYYPSGIKKCSTKEQEEEMEK
jgi:hypothetical protein